MRDFPGELRWRATHDPNLGNRLMVMCTTESLLLQCGTIQMVLSIILLAKK